MVLQAFWYILLLNDRFRKMKCGARKKRQNQNHWFIKRAIFVIEDSLSCLIPIDQDMIQRCRTRFQDSGLRNGQHRP
eukprot:ANDGO_07642.mRNA.1 hypothetical protein